MLSKGDKDKVPPGEAGGTPGVDSDTAQMVGATTEGAAYPPIPPSGRVASGSGARYERNQKILLGLAVAILVLVVVSATFALGYVVGNDGDGVRPQVGRAPSVGQRAGGGPEAGGDTIRGQFRDLIESGEATVLRGEIAAVGGGSVTVKTQSGEQAVTLTESTKYFRPGPEGDAADESSLAVGDWALVIAKKGAGGNLEAAAVRIGRRLQK